MYPSVTYGDVLKTVVLFAVQKCHFKFRHKRQITIEVVTVLLLSACLAFIWKVYPTYDAIPSSEQIIYNSGEIPGGKRQHLAYVTNVNASEFYFFFGFTL